jgi:hypothetical protein
LRKRIWPADTSLHAQHRLTDPLWLLWAELSDEPRLAPCLHSSLTVFCACSCCCRGAAAVACPCCRSSPTSKSAHQPHPLCTTWQQEHPPEGLTCPQAPPAGLERCQAAAAAIATAAAAAAARRRCGSSQPAVCRCSRPACCCSIWLASCDRSRQACARQQAPDPLAELGQHSEAAAEERAGAGPSTGRGEDSPGL